MDTATALTNSALFEGARPEDVAALVAIATRVRFGPQERVYEAGSVGDALYIIAEGLFTVLVQDEHGDEIEVARLKPGTSFGEMEVIGGMNRTATVMSETDGACIRLEAMALNDVLRRSDRLAAHFYRRVSEELVRRLRDTTRSMGYFKARAL